MNKLTLIITLALLSFSCSNPLNTLSNKSNIIQGSVLDIKKVRKLKIGMIKTQVIDLIGSPSIIDTFHNNQWDYINHSTTNEHGEISYRLTLTFANDELIDINTKGVKSLIKE